MANCANLLISLTKYKTTVLLMTCFGYDCSYSFNIFRNTKEVIENKTKI